MAVHIGIDVRLITDKMSGIGAYAFNLFRYLQRATELKVTFYDDDHFAEVKDFDRFSRRGWRKMAYIYWLNSRFPKILLEEGVDLLHSPNFVPPLWKGPPSVVTFHDMGFLRYPHTHHGWYAALFPSLVNAAVQRARRIITPSHSSRNEIIHFYPRAKNKIRVIYEAAAENFRLIDNQVELEQLRVKYNLPHRFILCVGTLEPRKNLHRFIGAFKIWREKNVQPEVKLVLCGKSWIRHQKFLQFLHSSGAEADIILTGYVPADEIAGIYNLAQALAFPSYYEGFGLPAVEAMNCGLPVMASNAFSLPEVLGEAAVYFDPFSQQDMIQAMNLVLNNRDQQIRLKELGLQRGKMFSWQKTAQMTEEVYLEALNM